MTIVQRIDRLEAKHLDAVGAAQPDPLLISGWGFIQLEGLAKFWTSRENGRTGVIAAQEALLSGLFSLNRPWCYLVLGKPEAIDLYLALPGGMDALEIWMSALSSSFPGCEAKTGIIPASICTQLAAMRFAATLTGNPAVNSNKNNPAAASGPSDCGKLDSVLRTLVGKRFAYLFLANPVAANEISRAVSLLLSDEREIKSNFQRRGSAEETNHPQAQHCLDLIAAARERFKLGQQIGMWDVHAFLLAAQRSDLVRGMHALHGAFSGAESRPQPIRVRICQPGGLNDLSLASTRLNTREATVLAKLPEEEFPGFRLREHVSFAVSPPLVEPTCAVEIGLILRDGRRTPNWFCVATDDLARHALIAGVSGSGKTNTCKAVLSQLWTEKQIPWMVVEPSVKSEYRNLLNSDLSGDLRIFTLGDESGVPLRLNPLEVLPGIHVQTHIDSVLSLFNAAFAWVSPMPEVLNLAMHRLYADFGWDLARGTHPSGHTREAQPTLRDLLQMIPNLVSELGYNSEISSTIRAGLLTRLTSLTLGGKGAMFAGNVSIPMDYLLSKPTVLELASVGNDEEKAFILGSFLLRLAQFRQQTGLNSGRLLHVLLIEEAHRLLSAVPANIGTDAANPRGKAVESFCHLLAEIRAFGQGVIAAEQIPSKLAPDVLKNTNLKVVHRLLAEDDRHLVGATMNLTETQERFLSALPKGQAIAYSEGREASFHISLPHFGRDRTGEANPPSKRAIIEHMKTRLPALPPVAHMLRPQPGIPPVADLASCRGCNGGQCLSRRNVLEMLVSQDLSSDFQKASEGGWEALWSFGMNAARGISVNQRPAFAYCVLMNVASLAQFDPDAIQAMRRNLGVLRERSINSL